MLGRARFPGTGLFRARRLREHYASTPFLLS
jgi:hypothetical protein